MYIPVMHARQSERLAVANVVGKLVPAGNVLPFYIPVADNKKGSGSGLHAIELLIKRFSVDKLPYILLTTPYMAKMPYGQVDILNVIATLDMNGMCTAAVAASANKPISILRSEIKALNGRKFVVLHVSPSQDLAKLKALLTEHADDIAWHVFYQGFCNQDYCDNWKGNPRAIVDDGFKRLANNEAYAAHTDYEFSNLGFHYAKDGFQAYGDHTITGELFTPGGGLPNAITIHLTHQQPLTKPHKTIWIRHFVSNHVTRATPENERFLEALNKLVTFYRTHRAALAYSTACLEFEQLLKQSRYPKLGPIKTLSIQHHIEMMSHLNL